MIRNKDPGSTPRSDGGSFNCYCIGSPPPTVTGSSGFQEMRGVLKTLVHVQTLSTIGEETAVGEGRIRSVQVRSGEALG